MIQVEMNQTLLREEEEREQDCKYDDLARLDFFAYGVGHFINDLTSTCWFNYLLLFLKLVVRTPAASAAILAGQITDGLATPLVGYLSDRTNTHLGKRMPWYIGGLVLIMVAFFPTFIDVKEVLTVSADMEYLYYLVFPSLFNVGWASLQISHMSLVPALTCSRKRRDILNNLRNTFTFVANLTVLVVGFFIFLLFTNPAREFALLALIALCLGLLASILFICRIKEPELEQAAIAHKERLTKRLQGGEESESVAEAIVGTEGNATEEEHSLCSWFRMPIFYLFGLSYMGFRLYTNLFGTLVPFYLIYVLRLATDEDIATNHIPFEMASIPLVAYLFSVMASLALPFLYQRIGRKSVVAIGLGLNLGYSLLLYNLERTWLMYVVAALEGTSSCLVLSTGTNLISEVVGSKSSKGAFVFGVYSFLDKFSSGIAIFLISQSAQFNEDNKEFVRAVTVLVPSAACLVGSLVVLLARVQEYTRGALRRTTGRLRRLKSELVV